MIVIVTQLLVAVVGLLMYVLASNGKVQEIGRLMFAVGLLVSLLGVGALSGISITSKPSRVAVSL